MPLTLPGGHDADYVVFHNFSDLTTYQIAHNEATVTTTTNSDISTANPG
jgi:hypothetical protein